MKILKEGQAEVRLVKKAGEFRLYNIIWDKNDIMFFDPLDISVTADKLNSNVIQELKREIETMVTDKFDKQDYISALMKKVLPISEVDFDEYDFDNLLARTEGGTKPMRSFITESDLNIGRTLISKGSQVLFEDDDDVSEIDSEEDMDTDDVDDEVAYFIVRFDTDAEIVDSVKDAFDSSTDLTWDSEAGTDSGWFLFFKYLPKTKDEVKDKIDSVLSDFDYEIFEKV